jgi:chaperonin GroES
MAINKGTIPQELQRYMALDNIVSELDEQTLAKLASKAINGIKMDEESSFKWNDQMDDAMKIAKQTLEGKSWPWPNASNILYPLISSACIQFNARTNHEIIQGEKAVNVAVMIPDPQGTEEDRAERLSDHMSYQLLGQSPNWRRDTDKLTMILAMAGTVYRKSYFDPIEKRPQIDLCLPSQIIIDNSISSLAAAQRITHVLHLSTNQILERMNGGIYEKYSFEDLGIEDEEEIKESGSGESEASDNLSQGSTDHSLEEVYEQEMFADLDNDDYKEPYILTIHKNSEKILRIVARYDEESFLFGDDGQFVRIKPIEHYTDYHFIPSPDGSFLSMGFGRLLYPINSVINSTLNQLMDAGTLANLQCGILGKDSRDKKQEWKFKPGEFKWMNVRAGSTLQQNVMPLPIKEPSAVLYNLLQFMIQTGEKLGSISDVLLGQAPGANTPATTVMAMIEQGMKVYSSMLYRLYDSFQSEFEKLYAINKKYLADEETFMFATKSGMVRREDYEQPEYGVFPVLDPTMSSDAMRLARAQALEGMKEDPNIDPREVTKRFLKALKVPNIEEIMTPEPDPNAPPPIEEQQAEAELELTHTNIQKTHMEIGDILMNAQDRAEKTQIAADNVQVQAAIGGATAASQKIASINQTAMTDAQIGEKQYAIAEKQVASEQQGIPIAPVDLSGSQATLSMMEQIAGVQPQGQPAPGGAPGSAPTGEPGGTPGGAPQIPPELGGAAPPQGQMPTSVGGAQAQGEEPLTSE